MFQDDPKETGPAGGGAKSRRIAEAFPSRHFQPANPSSRPRVPHGGLLKPIGDPNARAGCT